MPTRRDFLRHSAAGLSTLALGPALANASDSPAAAPAPASPAPGARPNVLFIICDDLAATTLLEHPQVYAPNFRRLAARGVTFTAAHCPTPLCSPARASILSGFYPHTTGLHGYKQQLFHFRQNPTLRHATLLPEHFFQHGYDTLATGKIFHNGHEDNAVWRRHDRARATGPAASFGPMPWDGLGKNDKGWMPHPNLPAPLNQPTRGAWDLGWGRLSDVPDFPPNPATGAPGYRGWWDYDRPFRYNGPNDRDLMQDEASAAWASRILRAPAERPFFLAVGFSRPHSPLIVPDEFLDLVPPADRLLLPPRLPDDLADCAAPLQDSNRSDTGFRKFRRLQEAVIGGDAALRELFRHYLASIAFADAQLGKLLDALDAGPHAAKTHVVFTADHGFHFGEKDYVHKFTLWSPSTRVPLVIAGPAAAASAGQRCTLPVSTVHVYATLNDLCGLPSQPKHKKELPPLDGHTLRPLLERPVQQEWTGPRVALTSIAGTDELKPDEPGAPDRQHYSVVSTTHRYTRCADGSEELYDLRLDPNEFTNLAASPAHAEIKSTLRAQLADLLPKAR